PATATSPTPLSTLSLHDALPISWYDRRVAGPNSTLTDYFAEVRTGPTANAKDFKVTTGATDWNVTSSLIAPNFGDYTDNASSGTDRKSTRLNFSHVSISYAVFCL